MPVLFDSSVYIEAFRLGGEPGIIVRRMAKGAPIWLSSVVLGELYAGADRHDVQVVEELERGFQRIGRALVPNLNDWAHAGRVLAWLGAKYGYEHVGKRRMMNDALIATSAGRTGITVITSNARDFDRIAQCRPFQWRVATL
jgi:predicted nucleic acid-binding protein